MINAAHESLAPRIAAPGFFCCFIHIGEEDSFMKTDTMKNTGLCRRAFSPFDDSATERRRRMGLVSETGNQIKQHRVLSMCLPRNILMISC